jgi:hypothetical protein
VPQSARLRREYLRLVERLLAQDREEIRVTLGPGAQALELHLRRLDDARRTSAELEDATLAVEEPDLLAALDAYAEADHLLQPTMDLVASVIDDAIAQAGMSVDTETYTCVLPTGLFNAEARLTQDGVLILINTGLALLLFQAAQAFAADAQFEAPGSGRRLYTSGQIRENYVGMVLAYLAYGDSSLSAKLPFQGGVRGQFTDALWQSAQFFVAAHEFGHVLGEHLSTARTKLLPAPGWEGIELTAKTQEQEVEADQIAVRLAVAHVRASGDLRAPSTMIMGPLFFLALAQSIARVRWAVAGGGPLLREPDHPPPNERSAAIREEFANHFEPAEFECADAAVSWIDEATDGVLEFVAKARADGGPRNAGSQRARGPRMPPDGSRR